MTEKRYFALIGEDGYVYPVFFDSENEDKEIDVDTVVDLLNENEQLAKEKERYKRLSEIRREEINNRIITIKEFIENCSDNKVKKILKDLFYSEVKEYDLSAQNRKLLYENEQLKQQEKRLYKYFRKCFDNVSEQGFRETWEVVKKYD